LEDVVEVKYFDRTPGVSSTMLREKINENN